jgi:hypothetical protein
MLIVLLLGGRVRWRSGILVVCAVSIPYLVLVSFHETPAIRNMEKALINQQLFLESLQPSNTVSLPTTGHTPSPQQIFPSHTSSHVPINQQQKDVLSGSG